MLKNELYFIIFMNKYIQILLNFYLLSFDLLSVKVASNRKLKLAKLKGYLAVFKYEIPASQTFF